MQENFFTEDFLKRLDKIILFIKRKFQGVEGENPSARRGGLVEFSDFKEYSHGDDLRYVDWNIYSRTDKLFIKQFSSEDQINLFLLIDNSPSMNFGSVNKLFFAKCLAIAFGYIALSTENIVKIPQEKVFSSSYVNTFTNISQAPSFVKFATNISPAKNFRFSNLLEEFVSSLNRKGMVVIFSDLLEEAELQKKIACLSVSGCDIIIIHILSEEELSPKLSGSIVLKDAETFQRRFVYISKDYLQNYKKRVADFIEKWRNFSNKHGLRYVFFNTKQDIEEAIFDIFVKERIFAMR